MKSGQQVAYKAPKRGKKAPPVLRHLSTFTADGPAPSATKKGPGRKHAKSSNDTAPRVAPWRYDRSLPLNIGSRDGEGRHSWRYGEPIHIVKPVRAARRAAKKAAGGKA